MIIFKVNEVELKSDIFDVSFAKNYEKIAKDISNIKDDLAKDDFSFSYKIEFICKTIFNCIDSLFGENKHLEIFKDEVNAYETIKVWKEIQSNIEKDAIKTTEEVTALIDD